MMLNSTRRRMPVLKSTLGLLLTVSLGIFCGYELHSVHAWLSGRRASLPSLEEQVGVLMYALMQLPVLVLTPPAIAVLITSTVISAIVARKSLLGGAICLGTGCCIASYLGLVALSR